MLNQVILVGRITTIEKKENNAMVNIAVPRYFKNKDGEYETDFINIELIGGCANSTKEYCRKGDMIGIRGRLQTKENELYVVADKVTFLSSKPKEENEDNEEE